MPPPLSATAASEPIEPRGTRVLARLGAAWGRARRSDSIERATRAVPIRWRILAIAVLNSVLALVLLALVGSGAKRLTAAWDELLQVRRSEQFIIGIVGDAERVQILIHRYFHQPDPTVLGEIVERREPLIGRLRVQARLDPLISDTAQSLTAITERFLESFDELRAVRSGISQTYEIDLLRSAREMAAVYQALDRSVRASDSPIGPMLDRSREAFNAMLLAANAYYLATAQDSGEEAKRNADEIARSAAQMRAQVQDEPQRGSLAALEKHATSARGALDRLSEAFAGQAKLLREGIDANADAMASAARDLRGHIQKRELAAQDRFDRTLRDIETRVAVVALAFILAVVLMGIGIAKSISDPLRQLRRAMLAIVAGDYRRRLKGPHPRDEIGEMARAVDVFRDNAIAKHDAEDALRAAKDRAEKALDELKDAQENLVEAEKLAALGGLVAGVAHEVNNPVGISLTVATSLAHRCREFGREVEAGSLRRSRLLEFVGASQDAANQLETNLQRAGELIQNFKQVAVDRSDAERRRFDLRDVVNQIASSLRPGLKTTAIQLEADVEGGLFLDSFPGSLGQILTNLFLNSVKHGFLEGQPGTIRFEARRRGEDAVELVVRDNGAGMSEEVERRAFEPFFTTRRGEGGTGLGLHIVYNLVVRRLGGRIALSSAPGQGTTFRMVLPLVAPRSHVAPELVGR